MAMFVPNSADKVRVSLCSGDVLEGDCHPDCRSVSLVGRCLDLSKATRVGEQFTEVPSDLLNRSFAWPGDSSWEDQDLSFL